MIKLLLLAKKVHRLFVMFTSVIIIVMASTGLILKEPEWFNNFSFIDFGLIRYLHNKMSPYLTIVLLVMMLTGLILYFVPKILTRKRQQPSTSNSN
jgi:uncharacterized membrane protein